MERGTWILKPFQEFWRGPVMDAWMSTGLGSYHPILILLLLILIVTLLAWLLTPLQNTLALELVEGQASRAALGVIGYNFLHAHVGHAAGNLLGLWALGSFAPKDKVPLIVLIWLLSGVGAGLLALLWAPKTQLRVVGASAGVFGVMAYSTLVRPDLHFVLPTLPPLPLSLVFPILMVVSLALALISRKSVVWHQGHFWGGLVGLRLTLYFQASSWDVLTNLVQRSWRILM